jgi:hypothetical protein
MNFVTKAVLGGRRTAIAAFAKARLKAVLQTSLVLNSIALEDCSFEDLSFR